MKKFLFSVSICISTFGKTQILISNVNVIPMNDSVVLMGQDVLIENGIIKDIHPISSFPIDKKIKIIDGKGMYMMPGFADMHAHLPSDGQGFSNKEYMRLMLSAGITTVRSMRGNDAELKLRDSLKNGLMKGPELFVSAVLPTDDSLMKGNWKEKFFENAVKNKYDFVKYLGGIDSNQMKEISKLCKKNKLILCGHAFEGSVDKSLALGFRSIEHFQPLLKKYFSYNKRSEFISAIEKYKKANMFFCPTFSFYYVYGFQFTNEELKNRSGMKFIPEKIRSQWEKEITDFENDQLRNTPVPNSCTDDDTNACKRNELKLNNLLRFAGACRALKLLDSAGIKVLLSADDGIYNVPGYSLYEEMKIFTNNDWLSVYRIYRMATVNAASFFQQKNYTGTVTKNSSANLCLYEKNPLQTIDNLKTLKAVIVKGKFYLKEEL